MKRAAHGDEVYALVAASAFVVAALLSRRCISEGRFSAPLPNPEAFKGPGTIGLLRRLKECRTSSGATRRELPNAPRNGGLKGSNSIQQR